ncbi:MAG: hypothetical protein F6K55_17245 [Moorea sp. SIO4A3]|nr:hypothetical protein [Moorena sp. SIO4A3]
MPVLQQDASSTDCQGMILARCQFYSKMPVLPIAKAGYWQDASSTARCQFYRFPIPDSRFPIPDSRFPIP